MPFEANHREEEEIKPFPSELPDLPAPFSETIEETKDPQIPVDGLKSKFSLPLFLSLAMALGFGLGVFYASRSGGLSLNYPFSEIAEVSQLLEKYYFDSVSARKLSEEAIRGMLANLDPHSSYISKSETEEAHVALMGEFEGIGIQFNILKDTLLVVSVNAGGPSEKAGLLPGDKIIKVDTTPIVGIKIQTADVIKMLRGKKGSKVKVKILRHNQPLTFTIVRDKIPVHSLNVSYLIQPHIGYISISNFSLTTGKEFKDALTDLVVNQKTDKLILDLRGNPGGYLEAAIAICNEILPARQLIVYTYGQSVGKQEYFASTRGLFKSDGQKVAVLIDEYSASASEIVAGAIQDQDRGMVIGRRSFGKGLVQKQFNLRDGSEVMITVARYYTPTGRCIQKPFENDKQEAYDEDIYQRYLRGEMQSKDSISFPDSLCYYTPKGKTVYGGGGIMPDVFIPVRQSDSIVLFNLLSSQGIVFGYAMEYADANRTKIQSKYAKAEDFFKHFVINQLMIKEILSRGEGVGIVNYSLSEESKKALKLYTRAYISRHLYGEKAFYSLVNQEDETIQKAIQWLNGKD